jgi:hypothetical protein
MRREKSRAASSFSSIGNCPTPPLVRRLMRHDRGFARVGRRVAKRQALVCGRSKILREHEASGFLFEGRETRMRVGELEFAAGRLLAFALGFFLWPRARVS